jgi:fatty acid desaturase
MQKIGRLIFPLPLFAYPFYLWQRSPGKTGSHYDPKCDLFTKSEKNQVLTSNGFLLGMLAILGLCTAKFGMLAMFNLYFMPYWINVVWLDLVTYLHHHGPHDKDEQMPWYRCASCQTISNFPFPLFSCPRNFLLCWILRSTCSLFCTQLQPKKAYMQLMRQHPRNDGAYLLESPSGHICRGEEWSYLRGGLTALDRDYGIFNKIHHDIGTHVVHHLFPQIPHYKLEAATEACKPVMGPYYREVEPSPGWFPTHLIEPLIRSFRTDHYVDDTGDIVFYKTDPNLKLLGQIGGKKA